MSTSRMDLQNEFCKAFLDYRMNVIAKLPDVKKLTDMALSPEKYNLIKDGISHRLIHGYVHQDGEEKIFKSIGRIPGKQFFMRDLLYKYSPIYWSVVFNYANLFKHFVRFGSSLGDEASLGVNPTQLAVLLGARDLLSSHLNGYVKLTELHLLNNKFDLNELHLAILLGEIDIVSDIFKIFKKYNVALDGDVFNVGNILHLLVYAALIEVSHSQDGVPVNTIIIFDLVKHYFGERLNYFKTLYMSNLNRCTPLQLALKYSLPDMACLLTNAPLPIKTNERVSKYMNDWHPLRLSLSNKAVFLDESKKLFDSKSVLSDDKKSNQVVSTASASAASVCTASASAVASNPDSLVAIFSRMYHQQEKLSQPASASASGDATPVVPTLDQLVSFIRDYKLMSPVKPSAAVSVATSVSNSTPVTISVESAQPISALGGAPT